MKKILITCAFFMLLILSFQAQQLRVMVDGKVYDIYKVNLGKEKIEFFYTDESGKRLKNFEGLKNYLEKKHLGFSFATNGGIFDPKYEPNGLYVEDGTEKFPLNLSDGKGNFYLKPNGVFLIKNNGNAAIIGSTKYDKYRDQVHHAIQSGPLLLYNDKINPLFNENSENLLIRSGVGIVSDNHVIFAISNELVTFYEFAKMFQSFGCKSALYLDGVISKMYLPDIGRSDEMYGNFATIIVVIK